MVAHQRRDGPYHRDRHAKRDGAPRAVAVAERTLEPAGAVVREEVQVYGGGDDDEDERRGGGEQQCEEGRVVAPPDAVVHPLAVVVAPIDAVVALEVGLVWHLR